MSTDPYPEVSVDESGIVPPQGARASEWPKKLRTLTAAELDRLTIDDSGRFYWDGRDPRQACRATDGAGRQYPGGIPRRDRRGNLALGADHQGRRCEDQLITGRLKVSARSRNGVAACRGSTD